MSLIKLSQTSIGLKPTPHLTLWSFLISVAVLNQRYYLILTIGTNRKYCAWHIVIGLWFWAEIFKALCAGNAVWRKKALLQMLSDWRSCPVGILQGFILLVGNNSRIWKSPYQIGTHQYGSKYWKKIVAPLKAIMTKLSSQIFLRVIVS